MEERRKEKEEERKKERNHSYTWEQRTEKNPDIRGAICWIAEPKTNAHAYWHHRHAAGVVGGITNCLRTQFSGSRCIGAQNDFPT